MKKQNYDVKNIARVFRKAKAKNGATFFVMARELDISIQTLISISNGVKSNPTILTMVKIANYLGVPLQKFLQEDEE